MSSGGLTSTTIGSGKGQSTSKGSLFTASQGCWCRGCGAWRGSLGLEPTPDLYVQHLVEIMRECRRVLRDDGTLWLNIGDSYAVGKTGRSDHGIDDPTVALMGNTRGAESIGYARPRGVPPGLKPKDLVGIPWSVAFALRADGWYLRSDCIWAKGVSFRPDFSGSCMPESVRDRPTRGHEYLFLLTKGQWSTRTIQFSDLRDKVVEGGDHINANSPDTWGYQLSIALASSILQAPEVQRYLRLRFLHAEVGQKSAKGGGGALVAELPQEHRLLCEWAARLLDSDVSPKAFLQQVNRMGLRLSNRNALVVAGCSSKLSLAPTLYAKSDTSIAIQHAGQICEFDLRGHACSILRPLGCVYYYDYKAVQEDGRFPAGTRAAKGSGTREGNRRGHAKYLAQDKNAAARRIVERIGAHRDAGAPHGAGIGRVDVDANGYAIYSGKRNLRSVWAINPKSFKGAHFATFPPALVEPCIKAGSKPGDVVLDPFAGSGTVGLVCHQLHRRFVGIELSPEYCLMAQRRIHHGQANKDCREEAR